MNEQYIIKVAESYLGEQETPGNSGWSDKDFERQMRNVGWQPGHAWCSYFCELVMKKAFAGNPMLINAFDKLFSPSATATFSNFAGSKMFPILKKPEPGALVVWRYGTGWTGHIGIVTSELQGSSFKTIEGNTNKAGEREGMFVMRKNRVHGASVLSKGLNVLGYIKVAR